MRTGNNSQRRTYPFVRASRVEAKTQRTQGVSHTFDVPSSCTGRRATSPPNGATATGLLRSRSGGGIGAEPSRTEPIGEEPVVQALRSEFVEDWSSCRTDDQLLQHHVVLGGAPAVHDPNQAPHTNPPLDSSHSGYKVRFNSIARCFHFNTAGLNVNVCY